MRNYWVRIFLGALAVFAIGMLGRALLRHGEARVRSVVQSSDPISFPLPFVPFTIGGEKLGTVERVTLQRETPGRVASVELELKLSDSLLVKGLEGCRLAVNLDTDRNDSTGIDIRPGAFRESGFWCVGEDSTDSTLVEYGHAVLHPGPVFVPLLLSRHVVNELQHLDLGMHQHSATPGSEAQAESLAAQVERRVDSIVEAKGEKIEAAQASRHLVDSLRAEGQRRGLEGQRRGAEGQRRADSARKAR